MVVLEEVFLESHRSPKFTIGKPEALLVSNFAKRKLSKVLKSKSSKNKSKRFECREPDQ